MLSIENPNKFRINSILFHRITRTILISERKSGLISLVLVSPQKIRILNKKWRNINKDTDVLTFVLHDKALLGEIYLCPAYVEALNKTQEVQNASIEIARSFIHGLLHLLGHHHNTKQDLKKVISLENKYIKQIFKISYGQKYFN